MASMNKAFVKEAEDYGDRCPACGTGGRTVYHATLAAHLPDALQTQFADSAFFCPHPTCPVAYFDRFERTIAADSLLRPVYPKDPAAPICPCFGLTADDIETAARSGDVVRIREHLQRAGSDEAHCGTAAADGQSCLAAVQRHFMRFHGK